MHATSKSLMDTSFSTLSLSFILSVNSWQDFFFCPHLLTTVVYTHILGCESAAAFAYMCLHLHYCRKLQGGKYTHYSTHYLSSKVRRRTYVKNE